MALSQIQQLEHGRDFSDWLRSLRTPITNGVMPNLAVALAGYQSAATAFAEGGQFDTMTPGDYQEANRQFAQQFGKLSAVLATEYKPPKDSMTLVDVAAWMGAIIADLESREPGLFGVEAQAIG